MPNCKAGRRRRRHARAGSTEPTPSPTPSPTPLHVAAHRPAAADAARGSRVAPTRLARALPRAGAIGHPPPCPGPRTPMAARRPMRCRRLSADAELFVDVQASGLFADSKTFSRLRAAGGAGGHPGALSRATRVGGFLSSRHSCRRTSRANRFRTSTTSPTPTIPARPYRRPVAGADARARRASVALLAAAAAAPLRGAGRALPRTLLLGFVFHDARAGGQRPARPAARDGGQLRLPDRHLRAGAQRHAHVLPHPLAAARVLPDDHAVRGPCRRSGARLPAAVEAGICVLDGRRGASAARRGPPARGAAA